MATAPQHGFVSAAQSAATQAGFNLCGVVAYPFPEVHHFDAWIAGGNHGDMHYLAAHNEHGELRRRRLEAALPWARSVVVCAVNYNTAAPYSTEIHDPRKAWIARYAQGDDYHDVVLDKLRAVEARLHADFGDFPSRSYVDTGPIVERSLAEAAGIGWIGKNTCLIHERERLGSWLFLGCIVTGYELAAHEPLAIAAADRCGSCTACLEACPTGALVAPYQMDATRCISYLTIEKRGDIPEELRAGIGNHVFGCDICQDVCPWNRHAPLGTTPELQARPERIAPDLATLAALSPEQWRDMFRGSPLKRTKYHGLLRNVCVAMGNSGVKDFLPPLRELAAHEDPVIAEHALWAISRLED